mmetsp:Transcript_53489/g.121956  ORF Transcript_53489/g.121956 Transcript_53489/m.121956 type:complete len:164 (+) Transcript_53489:1407-1898(+)
MGGAWGGIGARWARSMGGRRPCCPVRKGLFVAGVFAFFSRTFFRSFFIFFLLFFGGGGGWDTFWRRPLACEAGLPAHLAGRDLEAWVGVTENLIGPNAMRPDDVVRACDGTTVGHGGWVDLGLGGWASVWVGHSLGLARVPQGGSTTLSPSLGGVAVIWRHPS